jgi:rod shape-determining protein MreD
MTAAALLQVTWAPRLEIAGAFPNLVLVAVVAITWCWGGRAGMLWACAGGVLLDLTATGPIGPHALALLCGAYLTGMWVRNVHRDSGLHAALAAALSTAAYSLVLVAADDTLGLPVPPLSVAAQLTAAACVYNALLTPLGLALLRRLSSTAIEAAS